jgi:hypothetical protein
MEEFIEINRYIQSTRADERRRFPEAQASIVAGKTYGRVWEFERVLLHENELKSKMVDCID